MTAGKCGYRVSFDYQSKTQREWTCSKPLWQDHDRCIWHANVEEKAVADIEAALDRGDTQLDGAVLRGVEAEDPLTFANCSLVEADFRDADLSESRFVECSLQGADFETTNLRLAHFLNGQLENANFRAVEAEGINFDYCEMWNCSITESELVDCHFFNSNLQKSLFVENNLSKAQFTESRLDQLTVCQSNISNSEFERISAEGIRLHDCSGGQVTVTDVQFTHGEISNCRLPFATLVDTDWKGATVYDCHMNYLEIEDATLQDSLWLDSDLSSCRFESASGESVTFKDVDFAESEIEMLRLTESEIEECGLSKANISDSTFNRTTFTRPQVELLEIWETEFQECTFTEMETHQMYFKRCEFAETSLSQVSFRDGNFHGCDLTGIDSLPDQLQEVTFYNADLSGLDLSEANLRGASLAYATLSEVDFTSATLRDVNAHEANLNMANLEAVDARNSHFEGADFEDAILIDADLRNSRLCRAKLYQAVLSDTLINNRTTFNEKCAYHYPRNSPDNDHAHRLEAAVWMHRSLQNLHEENELVQRARQHHVQKEEAYRKYHRGEGNRWQYLTYTINAHTTRHGENPWRVVWRSISVILLFALLFPSIGGIRGGETDAPLHVFPVQLSLLQLPWVAGLPYLDHFQTFLTSLYFSVVTFTTLGYGDFQPATPAAQFFAGVESLVGSLLMALFVFTLGRRTGW